MSKIKKFKKELELENVKLARKKMDLRIMELQEEIERVNVSIVAQDKGIEALELEISEMGE
jgi:hypothetical protein